MTRRAVRCHRCNEPTGSFHDTDEGPMPQERCAACLRYNGEIRGAPGEDIEEGFTCHVCGSSEFWADERCRNYRSVRNVPEDGTLYVSDVDDTETDEVTIHCAGCDVAVDHPWEWY